MLDRKLFPRAMPMCDPLPADDQVLAALVHEERRRPDERVARITTSRSGTATP